MSSRNQPWRLSLLLYYYFKEKISRSPTWYMRGTRIPIGIPSGESGPGTEYEILWASAATAAISQIVGPGYLPDYQIVTSREAAGLVYDTLPYGLSKGEVDNIIPVRNLCSPENILTRQIAVRALRILEKHHSPLSSYLKALVNNTWLRLIGALCDTGRARVDRLLELARRRIRRGEAPPRFRLLAPVMLNSSGHLYGQSERGLMYLDVYAELRALANVLERYHIPVNIGFYRNRVFRNPEKSVIVCYQPYISGSGGGCEDRPRPDIVVIDKPNKHLIVIEVKLALNADEVKEKVREARDQLVKYAYLIAVGGKYVCGSFKLGAEHSLEALEAIAAYYTPGGTDHSSISGIGDQICLPFYEAGNIHLRVSHIDELPKLLAYYPNPPNSSG